MTTAMEAMHRARTHLILDWPFFGSLMLRLELVEDSRVQTASVDGKRIRFNPGFVLKLDNLQRCGLLAHEALHCAMGHAHRRNNREFERWNIACDMAINWFITDSGLALPGGALFDTANPPRCAEVIYRELDEQRQAEQSDDSQDSHDTGGAAGCSGGAAGPDSDDETPDDSSGNDSQDDTDGDDTDGNGDDDTDGSHLDDTGDDESGEPVIDPGGCGAVCDASSDDESAGEPDDNTVEQWEIATVQAARAATMRGNCPAVGKRLLDAYTRPPLPWTTLLADFVERCARNDYDWNKPNTRHIAREFILPGIRSNELPDVVIVLDSSGSTYRQLSAFVAAISDVLAAYPTRAHVLDCDAFVHSVTEYESSDLPIKAPEIRGGGGTWFAPAFQWVENAGIAPACLIYFTDLDGGFPENEPDYPVIWVNCKPSGGYAPFGEIVNMTD